MTVWLPLTPSEVLLQSLIMETMSSTTQSRSNSRSRLISYDPMAGVTPDSI